MAAQIWCCINFDLYILDFGVASMFNWVAVVVRKRWRSNNTSKDVAHLGKLVSFSNWEKIYFFSEWGDFCLVLKCPRPFVSSSNWKKFCFLLYCDTNLFYLLSGGALHCSSNWKKMVPLYHTRRSFVPFSKKEIFLLLKVEGLFFFFKVYFQILLKIYLRLPWDVFLSGQQLFCKKSYPFHKVFFAISSCLPVSETTQNLKFRSLIRNT